MEQSPLDPKGTIVYESILLQHLLHISTTEACGISIATAVTGGQIMERCSFHLVPHFEECSPGVTANCEFNFWELHETFPISTL
jgi:hypothetical protein